MSRLDEKDFLDYDALGDAEFERLARDGLVNVEPGIDQDELFEDDFDRRARELNVKPFQQAAATQVQKVEMVDVAEGEWSGIASGYYGQSQPYIKTANNTQTILKMPQRGAPQRWTLWLSQSVSEADLAISGFFQVTAVVDCGAGGASHRIEVDWGNDVAIPLLGNAFEVNAVYTSINPVPGSLRLTATLGRGWSGVCKCPTRGLVTTGLVNTGNNQTTPFKIPPFAKSVWVVAQGTNNGVFYNTASEIFDPAPIVPPYPAGAGVSRLDFGTSATTIASGLSYPGYLFRSGPQPIPMGMRYASVFNNTGLTSSFGLLFQLGL